MAFSKISVSRDGLHYYVGLSTDVKPVATTVPPGSKFWESDTDDVYKCSGTAWVKTQEDFRRLAGERNEDSETGADYSAVAGEWDVIAMAYNGTAGARTVYAGPCLVAGFEVTTAMSAHASNLQDNSVDKYPIPASRAVGFYAFPGPIKFYTDCVWAPGSLSAGALLVWFKPLDARVDAP
ncbi:MAG: hypothetical protein AB7I42_26070 [Bradyrhizobium sp.]|uniref:hypothetical protein n=1 Tax=Bradyrhizobium sp. TaxID=376 RepID=UPI003D10260E